MTAMDNHGHRTRKPRKIDPALTVRKLSADAVPYGDCISTNGKYVYGAYHADELVGVAANQIKRRSH